MENLNTCKPKANVIFYGTALIDLIVSTTHEFFRENNIEPDTLNITNFQKTKMLDKLEQFKTNILAGGSCFNIMRMLNYLVHLKNNSLDYNVCAFGSVTDDKYGNSFISQLKEEKISTYIEKKQDQSTNSGLCAVLCADFEKDGEIIKERSLLTDLGSSGKLSQDHVDSCWKEISQACKETKLSFIESSLIDNIDVIKKFIDISKECDSHIVCNIFKSDFLTKYKESYKLLLENSTIIFCNINEAIFFITEILCINLDHSNDNEKDKKVLTIEEVAFKLASNIENKNKNPEKLLIITNSKKPSHVLRYSYETQTIVENQESSTFYINEEEIIDTNGCGDSFLGGFLASLITGKKLKKCLQIGNICGAFALKNSGFNIPKGKIEKDLLIEINKVYDQSE